LPTVGITELVTVKRTAERSLRVLLWQAHRLWLLTLSSICSGVALQRKVGSVIHSSAHPRLNLAAVEVCNCAGCLSIHPGVLQVSLAICFAMILLLVVHFISSELRGREVLLAGAVVLELLKSCWILAFVVVCISFWLVSQLSLASFWVCVGISIERTLAAG